MIDYDCILSNPLSYINIDCNRIVMKLFKLFSNNQIFQFQEKLLNEPKRIISFQKFVNVLIFHVQNYRDLTCAKL